MDIVLGVSMAPASVQMVLLQGENADGATVDENEFTVTASDDSPTVSASERVIAAIVSTREDAVGAGLELSSVGVAWTDELEAAALRDALADHKIENVMLVSAFLAATALTQSVGGSMGYEQTAMLFVEPGTATLAVVETSDGSVIDVHEEQLDTSSGEIATASSQRWSPRLDELPTPSGRPVCYSAPVSTSARSSRVWKKRHRLPSTHRKSQRPRWPAERPWHRRTCSRRRLRALAYAQDRGTGAIEVSARPEYLSVTDAELGEDDLAYSAVADDEANAPTVVIDARVDERARLRRAPVSRNRGWRWPAISAALALEVALSLGIRTTVGLLPAPIHDFIAPVQQVLAPAPGPWPRRR